MGARTAESLEAAFSIVQPLCVPHYIMVVSVFFSIIIIII